MNDFIKNLSWENVVESIFAIVILVIVYFVLKSLIKLIKKINKKIFANKRTKKANIKVIKKEKAKDLEDLVKIEEHYDNLHGKGAFRKFQSEAKRSSNHKKSRGNK